MGVSKLKFGGVLVNSVTTNSLTTHKVRINGNLVYDDSAEWTGLKFTSVGYNTLQFIQQGNWVGSWPIEYSRDNGETWREYTLSTTFNLSDGATIFWRGQKDSTSQSISNYRKFYIGGTGTMVVSGDVTSLLNGVGGVTDLTPYGNYTLTQLFDSCTSITSAPDLPSTTLSSSCYYGMFEGCTSLVESPVLPASTLVQSCYYRMFYNCSSLSSISCMATSGASENLISWAFGVANSGVVHWNGETWPGFNDGANGVPTNWSLDPAYYVTLNASATNGSIAATVGGSPVQLPYDAPWRSYATLSVTPDSGYEFTQWSDGNTDNPRTLHMLNGKSLTTTCEPATVYHTVTFSCQHGTVIATVDGVEIQSGVQVEHGKSVVFTIYPSAHYHYHYTNPETVLVDADVTRNYVCDIDVFFVDFSCTNGSVGATVDGIGIQSGGFVDYGKTVVFTITPNEGYEYTGTNPESVVVHDNVEKNYECTLIPVVVTPLKFTANTVGSTISFNQLDTWGGTWPIEISTDAENWSSYTLGTTITLTNVGDYVCFRGQKDSTAQTSTIYRKFVMTGSIAASGDITSLLNGTGGVSDLTTYGNYTFCRMFYRCTSLTTAPSLPATTLAESCYYKMFSGCTSLTSAPTLPSTTLEHSCYDGMFQGCTSLTTAPSLPATTLAYYCYANMFQNCTSLTSAPVLPATTLAISCYSTMFYQCTSLTTAPSLPATTLAQYCYNTMFWGCTKLIGPVNIAATSPYSSGTTSACSNMFTNSGTSRPSTPTGYNKIKVGGNVSLWNSTNAGISSTYWTVELITEGDIEEQ